MAAISLRDLRKSYGKDEVIHGVSCDIADGEFTVIVGPSGCGKSTLLRMVAGLEEVTAGEISIGGRVVNDVEPADRDIAMVFQNYALYPHMTVFGNMAYGLRIRRIDKAEIARRVEKTAAILELGDLLDRRPRQLSGGQRQRVAMGRAIVREPAVFLFDEPLSNLDAKLRVQMRLEIKKLHEALGTTSLYVTHDQIEAMTLGQRLIVMNAGVAEQIGAPLDIYRRPASIFVAGFIGSPAMNFMPATARGGSVELAGGVRLTLAGGGAGAADGRPVTLGIRPEHLEITGADGGIIQLKVGMVEALGADTLVHGMLNGAGPDSGHRLTARIPGGRAVAPGDSLSLTVDPAHLHLFDPDTGKRLEID